jgi:hypothetical protein
VLVVDVGIVVFVSDALVVSGDVSLVVVLPEFVVVIVTVFKVSVMLVDRFVVVGDAISVPGISEKCVRHEIFAFYTFKFRFLLHSQ